MRLIKFDSGSAELDATNGTVNFIAGYGRVSVSIDALENHFSRKLAGQEAVNAATEIAGLLRLVANATPDHEGRINITNAILNGRDWETEYAD